ncbi:MAG: hypothetical protein LBV52_05865, partial [Spirochaetaceae bacterium]|nr:hypothetical protein [Spirochaetaceae bacterium]
EWVPPGLTRKDLEKALKMAFNKFYWRPKTFFYMLKYIKLWQITFILKKLSVKNLFFKAKMKK